MRKDERIERCRELKASKSCSQAVALSFGDLTGLSDEILEHACEGFSSGMCTTCGTCGALTGAALVAGMALGTKEGTRGATAEIMKRFTERNGTTICRELKGLDGLGVRRSCEDCCADAAEFLSEALESRGVKL
ncbi:MAG: C-GCAxxG-C-C family protein [Muribaculaceae bacterium]|nr:C-GCAxxG-C-C family protein [Muribaculaceae bacterium]